MLDVVPIRAFADNYVWLLRGPADPASAVVVDPGDARPVAAVLDRDGLTLEAILVTHHHPDHVGGIAELTARGTAQGQAVTVVAPATEDVPAATRRVRGGDRVELPRSGLAFEVLDVPGHTAGHVAYVGHGAAFVGDTLFSAGCGRLFEGTAAQMLASLDALAALPEATRVYCAHEYTSANLRFALAAEPGNAAAAAHAARVRELRERDEPTLPSTIGRERAINPFLRVRTPALRAAIAARAGATPADDAAAFAELRGWKDQFR